MFQEERIVATVRHQSSSLAEDRGHFSSLVHAHEAVQSPGQNEPAANRKMVESLREAALKSFDHFIHDPMMAEEQFDTQEEFACLATALSQWQRGDLSLSQLIACMNDTLANGALQAHVALCERFISVHNIFSLLQLKQIQMQATQSLAMTMSHTSRR